jgi:hypothetical protein
MINYEVGMRKKSYILPLFFCFLAVALISPVNCQAWKWNGVELVKIPVRQFPHTSAAQLNPIFSNGQDCLQTTGQHVEVSRCTGEENYLTWKSPEGWQVKEVVMADFTRDGEKEFGLLVWRPFESWPIDKFLPYKGRIDSFHDRNYQSCHFILIGWDGTKYRELWAGSALADPISRLKTADINNDGFEELLALEKEYDASSGGNLTVWEWQGFGFTLVDRLEGNFSNYSIVVNDGQLIVITN